MSASLSLSGNRQSWMVLLTIVCKAGPQMSEFSLRFLRGILVTILALFGFRFLISNTTTSNVTVLKENKDPPS